MSKQLYFKHSSLAQAHSLGLLDPQIGYYQVLSLRTRVDLETMAIKEYITFPKASALLEPHHRIV